MIVNTLIDIDELKLLFCEPIQLNDKITLYQPTIGDIVDFGERQYYSTIHMLTCIPSDMKSQLFDMGIDWEEIPDFDLFIMLTRTITHEQTKLVFGDMDLSKMDIEQDPISKTIRLHDTEKDIVIDQLVYLKIMEYLRKLHSISPKVERAGNKATKKILIELDREKIQKASKEPYKSQLKELISGVMRFPGFKYKMCELKQCGLYEFMDSVQGAQIYISSTALLQGSYSGMIDTSGIDKKAFNWMRSSSSEKE